MLRVFRTQRHVFGGVLALTAILGLMPAKWPHTQWVGSAGDLVRIFTRPIEHAGSAVVHWLRPVKGTYDELPRDLQEQFHQIEVDRDTAITRIRQLERELEDLREINEQLLIAGAGSAQAELIIAPITGASNSPSLQTVDVKVAANVEVPTGAVAVYNGVHLIGRVTSVGRFSCEVSALTDPASGLLTARILPRGRTDSNLDDAPPIQLQPTGDGRFVGDARADDPIAIDDEVRLDDLRWPATAQMMIIGFIESIDEKPEQPLRRSVVVRPRHQLNELPHVILKIPIGLGEP